MHCWIAIFKFLCFLPIISTNYKVELKNHPAKLPSHFILRNISTSNIHQCLHNCFKESSCLSFQICGEICQLLSINITEGSLEEDGHCIYFTMKISSLEFNSNYCTESIHNTTDCCQESSYCYNNGTCQKQITPYNESCPFCECKEGFVGKRCEKKVMSCKSYRELNNGWYKIFTRENKTVKVYCQFDSMNAWTLVMSYSFKFRAQYRSHPYYENFPRNETKETWKDHRLSLNTMKSIKEDGNTLWRITCSYGENGWNATDFVIATHENAPVMEQNISVGVCRNVNVINVRGYECSKCNIPFWQSDSSIFHTDLDQGLCNLNVKNFQAPVCSGNGGEDNFGYYNCYNTRHRCASSDNATTQLWFGKRMKFNDD